MDNKKYILENEILEYKKKGHILYEDENGFYILEEIVDDEKKDIINSNNMTELVDDSKSPIVKKEEKIRQKKTTAKVIDELNDNVNNGTNK